MIHVLRFCFIYLLNYEEGGFCYMDVIIFQPSQNTGLLLLV